MAIASSLPESPTMAAIAAELLRAVSRGSQFMPWIRIFLICLAFHMSLDPRSVCAQVEEKIEFTPEQVEYFEEHIRPLLIKHCYDCHSTDAPELKGGLYVDSREGMLKGGDSGPALDLQDPQHSLLLESVRWDTLEMPPEGKLADAEIRVLQQWIEMGAPWPQVTSSEGTMLPTRTDWEKFNWQEAQAEHWAWQPVKRPDIPVADADLNPIDHFVAQRRAAGRVQAVAAAEPRILVRRIYLDLLGLPPTPEQIRAFETACIEDRKSAVSSLIDELLASPQYGQRWARHWLDVARYSDGQGGFLDNKALPQAWRYRDWVVNAMNEDLPIDTFLRLQIAGDLSQENEGEYPGVATGFFALGPTYRSDGGDPDSVAQAKGETLDDRIDTLTRGLLGVTGSCARCHDHKFDPVPQQDYYSLAGVFNNTAIQDMPLAPSEVVNTFEDHKRRLNEFDKRRKDIENRIKKDASTVSTDEYAELDVAHTQLEKLRANVPPSYETAHALRDAGSGDMHVAIRGNLRKTGDLAPRRFLRILSSGDDVPLTEGSGRKALAEAIVNPANPLTVRVFVNRVWMHHFGEGIVRTPSNFGVLGEAPTHPELLDFLADEFVQQGWSLKSLHRLIMNSETYQLSSSFDAKNFDVDGGNQLLWRMSPRRMDVEAWRDSLLAVTKELNVAPGGPPFSDAASDKRRTLYARVSRNGDVHPSDIFLRRFDFPLMRATVAKRPKSIVPQQYLFLLNSSFMVDRAKAMVARLEKMADSDEARIVQLYDILYGRKALEQETQLAMQFLAQASQVGNGELTSWQRYAQVMLSSNEFMFVR
ncbi:MAG: PSD1 and planctomycete cytochrome C domain-containing protein [Planctomycetota bacterium]